MFDLSQFSHDDAKRLGDEIGKCSKGATDIRAASESIVRFLYDNIRDAANNERAAALVRIFLTVPLSDLHGRIQQTVLEQLDDDYKHNHFTKCLVLLATAGIEPAWNAMISRMLTQFGLDLDAVLSVDPTALRQWQKTSLNAFHVPVAKGSPYIPAQDDFVKPYGVESVLGCGGILRSSRFFSLIVFSKSPVSDANADAFRNISGSIRSALEVGNMSRSAPLSL